MQNMCFQVWLQPRYFLGSSGQCSSSMCWWRARRPCTNACSTPYCERPCTSSTWTPSVGEAECVPRCLHRRSLLLLKSGWSDSCQDVNPKFVIVLFNKGKLMLIKMKWLYLNIGKYTFSKVCVCVYVCVFVCKTCIFFFTSFIHIVATQECLYLPNAQVCSKPTRGIYSMYNRKTRGSVPNAG